MSCEHKYDWSKVQTVGEVGTWRPVRDGEYNNGDFPGIKNPWQRTTKIMAKCSLCGESEELFNVEVADESEVLSGDVPKW